MNRNSTAVHNAQHMKFCEHELKLYIITKYMITPCPPPNISGNFPVLYQVNKAHIQGCPDPVMHCS
jgi:hypothetical protein